MGHSSKFLTFQPNDRLTFTGYLGAQSSTTLTMLNSFDSNAYFQIKLSHPEQYIVSAFEGMIQPFKSERIQITLKTLSSDYMNHKFIIRSAIDNDYVKQKLSVNIILHEKNLHKQQLELYVRHAVHTGQSLFDIEQRLFSNTNSISKAVKQFVTKQYTNNLIEVLKCFYKDIIRTIVERGDLSTIEKFRKERDTLTVQSEFWKEFSNEKHQRLLNNLDSDGQIIITNVKKYFDMCMTLYIDEDAETELRQLLIEWFKSGHMNKIVFDKWKHFEQYDKILPETIKQIDWQQLSANDYYTKQLNKILIRIKTNEFLHHQELHDILNIFAFGKTIFTTSKTNVLSVSNRIIFLSDVIQEIEKCTKHINEVHFYAKNVFNIDQNLKNDQWHGKNIVIIADKVHTWQAYSIDVSGQGYDQSNGRKRAEDGQSYGTNGKDGEDGKAGESSGNILFLTEELIEGELLTMKLNGGDGQHGEDGGNGADGRNGVGVSKENLNSLILKYSTLYWGSSNHFFQFTPSNTTERFRKFDTYNKYVSARFEDSNGRVMHWSYAEDYSYWSISTYDLYFVIKGTTGTAGGIGGLNGVGGEGGNRGECIARTLYSGKPLSIGKIQQNAGRSGEHGILGKPGRFGKNGNDMAFVDRSTLSSGKKYIGENENMSIDFQYRMTGNDARIDGYEKWINERSSHYVHFQLKSIADGTLMSMTTEKKTDVNRQTQSKTLCKASIIVSDVLNEFAECYQQDDAILAEACRAQERVNIEEQNEDEEQEQTNLTEEVTVLLECADENKKTSGFDRPRKKHTNWTTFSKRLIKYDKQDQENLVELAFELFEHEPTEEQLNEVNMIIDQLINDFKQMNSMKNSSHIQHLAQTIDMNWKEKRSQAALRSRQTALFAYYLDFVDTSKHNPDPSKEILTGMKPRSKYDCTDKTKIITRFFKQYQTLGVSIELLDAMHTAFVYLQEKFNNNLTFFDVQRQFDWNDENAVKIHVDTIDKDNKTIRNLSPLDKLQNDLQVDLRNVEIVFKTFYDIVKGDKTKILLKRFGLLPTSKLAKEFTEENPEQSTSRFAYLTDHMRNYFSDKHGMARYIVKFYFQTRNILIFNRRLYVCNVLSNAEILHPGTGKILDRPLLDVDGLNFTEFIDEWKRYPLNIESSQCEDFMRTHDINAAAYRFLLAHESHINIRVYKSTRYATIELQENFNPNASKKLMLLSYNKTMYSIEPDLPYCSMVAARKQFVDKSLIHLPSTLNVCEYSSITKFFPKEYSSNISSWLNMFIAVNQQRASALLSLLNQRFQLDGCHLSIMELQAILNCYSHAAVVCHTDDDFLLQLAVLMPQHQILDAFLYVRIENALKRRLFKEQGNDILNAIHCVDSPHLKALFATKLNETMFDESVLSKVLIMLRYAVDRFQRLEKMTLAEWIDTSQRQKWSAIGDLLREYGAIGYYLAFLDNRNRPEEPMLRKCLQDISSIKLLIPEKVIARIAYLIAYDEVNANTIYLENLKQLLQVISKNYSHYLPVEQQNDTRVQLSGYPLLMNERNQNDLLAQIKLFHNDTYEPIFPTGERDINKLKSLIVGQHDSEKRKTQRKQEIDRLVMELNSSQNKNVRIINEIDEAIAKIFSKDRSHEIHLRDTQRMAILIAAESKKNTLLQVNTGEGKTLLIATLAILRVKQGKTVDVVTSSPVLAARDVEKMQTLFKHFHIIASHNCEEDLDRRKSAYKCQIVYGDLQHFQRDFLLHYFYKKNILGDRKRQCVIVDEVDNMLLDNGNNMLYLSHSIAGMESLRSLFVFLHRAVNVPLQGQEQYVQFETSYIRKQVLEDMFGFIEKQNLEKLHPNMKIEANRIWQKLIEMRIIDRDGLLCIQFNKDLPKDFLKILETVVTQTFAIRVNDYIRVILQRERQIQIPQYLHSFVLGHLDAFIENTKRAMFMYHNDEYVVDVDHKNTGCDLNPRVTIIDKNTGIDLATSQWSEGMHQALQLKHGCRLSPISLKAIFVSNVGYFKGYERIDGLSGTLGSIEESKSLADPDLYDCDLLRIPTWKPKNFYEHVPLVATNEAVWLQNIYEEVKDQIIARRSVLIICNSIVQVDKVQRGLERLHRLEKRAVLGKSKFAQLVRKHVMQGTSWKQVFVNKIMADAFEHLIVYRRDHDEFDLSDSKALRQGRLIIATNLAGRGTDIELDKGLQQSGGLHVIVAFLPDNCRIEEQAFGRASRCGHPGSGQIIALIENDKRLDASETPTIFQLKEFRDNAEVHRLQSLKRRYKYHTAVEESCLNKFWEYSSRSCESAQDTDNTSINMPTSMQVIYFALLDEWALWLDEKAPLIQQCLTNCSDNDRRTIIQSVEQFLTSHPLDSIEHAIQWIKSPQPLLALGLIELNKNRKIEAERMFYRVIRTFPEYAAEAYYYVGVIQQSITRQIYGELSFSTAFNVDTWKEYLIGTKEREIVKAMNAFHESRRHFSLRRLHCGELATIVARLQRANESIICTNGYADQHREYVAVHDAIVGNIDKFLGKPIESADLRHQNRDDLNAVVLRKTLKELGIITRTVLSQQLHDDQIEFICSRHPISRREFQIKLQEFRTTDDFRFESEGRPEFEVFELRRLFKLPSRLEFWKELRTLGVFQEESKYFTTRSSETIEGLTPVDLNTSDESQALRLQFTDIPLDSVNIFKLDDLLNLPKLEALLENGAVSTEFVAIVNLDRLLNLNVYMSNFEGFQLAELEEHLSINRTTAKWIVSVYIQAKILARDGNQIYRLIGTQNTDVSLPEVLRTAVEKFLVDRFAYTHALDALRNAFIKASKHPNISKSIHLPTNPYEDLLADMIECGIVMPSRVSLAIPRKIDNGYNEIVGVIEHIHDFNKIKNILEANRPTIADEDCTLVDTYKYIVDDGMDPNQELKYFVANGLKQVAIVEDDTTWLWLLAIGTILFIVVVVAVATFDRIGISIVLAAAAIALSAYTIYQIGSYAYYRIMRTTVKRTATIDKSKDFEFTVLREFNTAAFDEHIQRREQNVLLKKVHEGLNDLADQLANWLVSDIQTGLCLDEYLSDDINELANQFLNIDINEDLMQLTSTVVDRSCNNQHISEVIQFITQNYMTNVESSLYTSLKVEFTKKPLQRNPQIILNVLDDLRKEIVYLKSNMLRRIVEKTCSSFEDNLRDEARRLNINLKDIQFFSLPSNDAELQSDVSVASDENDDLQSEKPSLLSNDDELQSDVSVASDENDDLQSEKPSLPSKDAELQSDVSVASDENEELRSEKPSLPSNDDELQSDVSVASDDNEELRSEKPSLLSDDDELKSDVCQDSEENNESHEISQNTLLKFWSESIQNRYTVLISREISRNFREPLLRRFGAYIKNSIAVREESRSNQKALDSDIKIKQKYQTSEKIIQATSQVQFLEYEMQQVCAECWDIRRDISALRCMIINRYALPINAAASLEQMITKLICQAMPDINEFKLILQNIEKKNVYGESREDQSSILQLVLILHNQQFYIARNNMSKSENIPVTCFVYEGLCKISSKFGLIFHNADEFVAELIN